LFAHPNRTHIFLISGHKGVRHEIRQGEEKIAIFKKTEIFEFLIFVSLLMLPWENIFKLAKGTF